MPELLRRRRANIRVDIKTYASSFAENGAWWPEGLAGHQDFWS
jgi:hypothetical protein